MHQQQISNSRPSPISASTDMQHWSVLGDFISDPAVAAVIVAELDEMPEQKLQHSGLYLRAVAVVEAAQQARIQAAIDDVLAMDAQVAEYKRVAAHAMRTSGVFLFRCLRLICRASVKLINVGYGKLACASIHANEPDIAH